MKKWFFRFLNIGLTAAAMLLVCAIALFYWAVPNPRDIALVPMAVDAGTQKGAGFLTNATATPWMVYISAYNPATGQAKVTQVWAATDPLQAVSYGLPEMGMGDPIELRIIYAKKMVRQKSASTAETSPPDAPPSSRSLPAQSRPLQPGPEPTAPAPKAPAP